MDAAKSIGIGLLGLGVVGGGVAQTLAAKADALERQIGCPIVVRAALVRDMTKPRLVPPAAEIRLTTNPDDILNDSAIDVVVEVMGGEQPALDYMRRALRAGKHVITANKEVIAKHGPELSALAREHSVSLAYEASVGGGIPLIAPFRQGLLANSVNSLRAIINGTTNYILTKMAKEDVDLPQALSEAQALGYAEADPANDVEGTDAAYKLAILSSLAFHTYIPPEAVHREGIMRLAARDFRYAKELGYAIKLLAIAKGDSGAVQVRVHPAFLPQDAILAKVDGVFNAVQVEADLAGQVLFYGRGAGSLPTTSAILADLIELAQDLQRGAAIRPAVLIAAGRPVKAIAEIATRYYVRLTVADQPGVLAQIAQVLGSHRISIASVIQKEVDAAAQSAEIVIMTHTSQESGVQAALQAIAALPTVREIGNVIRVED